MKFQTQYRKDNVPGEKFTLTSRTIPDQSMTVSELMKRNQQGLGLAGAKVPIYHGEDEMPDFDRLDLSEKAELIRSNREQIERLQLEADQNQKEADKRKLREQYRLEFEAEREAQKPQSGEA